MKKTSFLFNRKCLRLLTCNLALLLILLVNGQAKAQTNDTIAPEILDFSFTTPSIIDTTDSAQNVKVNVRATDNDKGVKSIEVRFRSLSANQFVSVFINGEQRVSGDDRDGIYNAAATFPQYSKAGNWSVFEITVFDNVGNYVSLDADAIAAHGFVSELQVVCSDEDLTAPELADLSFTPSDINKADGSQTVNVSLRATDELTGIQNVDVYFFQPANDYLIAGSMNVQQPLSENNRSGNYSGALTFSQNTDAGTWYIAVRLRDRLGNVKTYQQEQLSTLGFPSELQVSGTTSTPNKSHKRVRFF